MFIIKMSFRIACAMLISVLIIFIFSKFSLAHTQLDLLDSYSITTNQNSSIEQMNQFLEEHQIEYQLNYQHDRNELASKLKYYSSFEKYLLIMKYQIKPEENTTTKVLKNTEDFYQHLPPLQQRQFNQYLDDYLTNIIGVKHE